MPITTFVSRIYHFAPTAESMFTDQCNEIAKKLYSTVVETSEVSEAISQLEKLSTVLDQLDVSQDRENYFRDSISRMKEYAVYLQDEIQKLSASDSNSEKKQDKECKVVTVKKDVKKVSEMPSDAVSIMFDFLSTEQKATSSPVCKAWRNELYGMPLRQNLLMLSKPHKLVLQVANFLKDYPQLGEFNKVRKVAYDVSSSCFFESNKRAKLKEIMPLSLEQTVSVRVRQKIKDAVFPYVKVDKKGKENEVVSIILDYYSGSPVPRK